MKVRRIAVLALALAGSAWAEDDPAGRPHTHWWLEFPDANLGWYAGGSAGQNTFDDNWVLLLSNDGSFTSYDADDSDAGWRLFGGAEWGRYLAAEFSYSDFGEATFTSHSDGSGTIWAAGPIRQSLHATGYELSLIGRWPVSQSWAVFARFGLLAQRAEFQITGETQIPPGPGPFSEKRSRDSQVNPAFGGGVEYRGLDPWRLIAGYRRAELETRFFSGNRGNTDVDVVSLSIAYAWGGGT